jgi:hypothetical protein
MRQLPLSPIPPLKNIKEIQRGGISMNDKGNSVSPVSQWIVIDGCTVILHYAASSDPAAARAVQNSLFNFQSSPQPIFCNDGESVR